MRACPNCESKGLLVALQSKESQLECSNCSELYPLGAGREVSRRELIKIIMATSGQ